MSLRLAAACLLAGVAFAGPAIAQSRADYSVAHDIRATLRQHPQLTVFDHVRSDLQDGIVILTGKVTTPSKRTAIEKGIARIDGVRAIRNEVAVLPPSPTDDELRYRVSRAIYGNPSFWSYAAMPNPPIHILVENGHVTLTGTVNSHVERTLARSLASGLGERSIVNELRAEGR